MTQFEKMLLDKGYIKYILNCKTMKFETVKKHTMSTMVNLDHRYFHNTDENVLKKIASGKSVMDEDFTWDDRNGEICFGLHEAGKPPTLISPRPRIEVKRIKDGREIIENEQYDDSMNIALKNIPDEEIFKAMYDRSIVIKIDLTAKHKRMLRVQRKRVKGYKLPENTKCVNRGTKWGNPIKLMGDMIYINAGYRRKILDPWVYYNVGDIDDVIYLYRKLWDGTKFQNQDLQYWSDKFKELDLKELEGKNLACFCSLSSPCHADVLIELAKSSACA